MKRESTVEGECGVRGAAKILNCHENTIRNYVRREQLLPDRRLPGSGYMRFKISYLEKWKKAEAGEIKVLALSSLQMKYGYAHCLGRDDATDTIEYERRPYELMGRNVQGHWVAFDPESE